MMNDKERFETKFNKTENGCWEWTAGCFQGTRYGAFYHNGMNRKANRSSYEFYVGPIPEGKIICHKCNNAACVNPEHLYAGTHLDNARDRDACGHTSKGSHRYNFKRNSNLREEILQLRSDGLKIDLICEKLGIGRNTYYRSLPEINGISEITRNARSQNLSFGIKKRHAEKPESICRGEKSGCSKIKECDVIYIRNARNNGTQLRELANKFGITEAAVSSICRRKTWKHI